MPISLPPRPQPPAPDHSTTNQPPVTPPPHTHKQCGWRAAEVQGSTLALLQGPETDPLALKQIKAAATLGARGEAVCVNYRRDGSSFVNRLQLSPLYDCAGRVSHMLGVLTAAPEAAWRIDAQRRAASAAAAAAGWEGGRAAAAAAVEGAPTQQHQ